VLTAAKGGGIIFAGNVFQYASRFFIGILLARLLGAEQFGLYNLAMTAAAVAAGLALLGLKPALVRYVSLYASRRDSAGLWGTLQIGLGLPALLGVLMGVGLYVLAPAIAERLFSEPRLVPLLRLVSLVVPFLALSRLIAAATRGFNKMQYTVIAQKISQPLIRLVLLLILAIIGLNAARALASFGLTTAVVFAMLLFFLHKLFPVNRPFRMARRDTRELLSFSLPIYLVNLIKTFRGSIQILLLGALNTVATVGVFTVATQVNTLGKMFHNSVVTASMPIVSELHGKGAWKQMGHYYQTVTKWTFTANLPIFLITILFAAPILSIFGRDYVGGATALILLAWANLVNASAGICGVVIDMSGNTSLKLFNSVVVTVLSLGLSVLLIPTWGLVGAAVAALVAAIVVNLLRLVEVFFVFRLLPYNLGFLKPILAGLVALIVAWAIRQSFATETDLFYTLINSILLLAIYAGVILALGLSQEDRVVLSRLRQRMRAVLSR
jgi:O-antigen/teichoic acid export membrane protein